LKEYEKVFYLPDTVLSEKYFSVQAPMLPFHAELFGICFRSYRNTRRIQRAFACVIPYFAV